MTQWKIGGGGILEQLAQLPEAAQIFEDLKELEVDPMNTRGDPHSTIQPYKDDRYGHVYSVVVGNGHVVVYRVLQDYPHVVLKRLVASP